MKIQKETELYCGTRHSIRRMTINGHSLVFKQSDSIFISYSSYFEGCYINKKSIPSVENLSKMGRGI